MTENGNLGQPIGVHTHDHLFYETGMIQLTEFDVIHSV